MKFRDEVRFWREHFPTARAREAADRAIDPIPSDRPMSVFIDAWIKAYVEAGGIRPKGRV